MSSDKKDYKPEDITLTIRRAEPRDVIILSLMYTFLICIILNLIFYLVNKDNYFKYLLTTSHFSILSITIIIFLTTVINSYSLFIESTIQSRKKRFYYKYEEQTYSSIFSISISTILSLIITIFILITISKYINLNKKFSINAFGTITIIIIIFLPLVAFFNFYFFKLNKILLYGALLLKEKFLSTIKENIDSELRTAKLNHWDLWLITLKIMNIEQIAIKLKAKKIKIINEIIYNFKQNVKSTDYILALNYNKGIIGYIIKNIDSSIVDNFVTGKIVPLLEKEMVVNSIHLDLKIEYGKENISKNNDIESISDIIADLK